MKKLVLALLALSTVIVSSCNKDGAFSGTSVKFRKANIAGSNMLALASASASGGNMIAPASNGLVTKAEGDITVGPKALYTVSDDGSMVEVTYNVDVEGADGEVAEAVKANLIISPGFVFPVGEGWLWLANCHFNVRGGWENYPQDGSAARQALSAIMNDFSARYHDRHGAHYLIRKSDGALFEWTLEAGAPDGMDDGFKQPTFLNGWFHQLGKDLFVKAGGWNYGGMSPGNVPSLTRLQDKGNTLDAVNVLGNNISCYKIFPAEDCLGVELSYGGFGGAMGVISAPTFEPSLLNTQTQGEKPFFLSIGGKLYLADSYDKEVEEGDGKDHWTRTEGCTDVYSLNISGGSISRGEMICSISERMYDNQNCISSSHTLTWWGGNDNDGVTIYTFDPEAGTLTSSKLPEHYPANEGEYVDGVAYRADGTAGFWECDLSKEAAEYVTLDWSSAADYQSKIVPSSLHLERFEAASKTLQYKAYLVNGTELNFYASVAPGADRGVIKTSVGSDGNAGMVVTTMVRLN